MYRSSDALPQQVNHQRSNQENAHFVCLKNHHLSVKKSLTNAHTCITFLRSQSSLHSSQFSQKEIILESMLFYGCNRTSNFHIKNSDKRISRGWFFMKRFFINVFTHYVIITQWAVESSGVKRCGSRLNFNRRVIDIWRDGTIFYERFFYERAA